MYIISYRYRCGKEKILKYSILLTVITNSDIQIGIQKYRNLL